MMEKSRSYLAERNSGRNPIENKNLWEKGFL